VRAAVAATPAATEAFLRGLGRRAIVFTELQCGDPHRAVDALAATLPRFAAEAPDHPMAQWPARFWGLLLAAPALRTAPPVGGRRPPGLAVLDGLGAGPRAALLLRLVAGLGDDDAARALGVDAATWRLALERALPRRADGGIDAEGWQLMAAAARATVEAVPAARLARWEQACDAALARHPQPAVETRPRWLLPLLWAGVATCVAGLAATFARPTATVAQGEAGPVHVQGAPLAAAGAPAATFDAAFARRTHPDLALLESPAEVPLQDLELLSWHAARLSEQLSDPAAAGLRLPSRPATVAVQGEVLEQRITAWDALPAEERAVRREHWQAWQALPAEQRAAVLDAAADFSALPAAGQQALRMRFAQLPYEERRGWLLGPRIGVAWPRLQPLLMQVPAAQRDPLRRTLDELTALQLDQLATLAQRTPPQERDALRRGLLSTAEADRTAWLRERMRR
jgi:hypothetical protein